MSYASAYGKYSVQTFASYQSSIKFMLSNQVARGISIAFHIQASSSGPLSNCMQKLGYYPSRKLIGWLLLNDALWHRPREVNRAELLMEFAIVACTQIILLVGHFWRLSQVMDLQSDDKIASKSHGLHHKAEETHWQCECASIDLCFVLWWHLWSWLELIVFYPPRSLCFTGLNEHVFNIGLRK